MGPLRNLKATELEITTESNVPIFNEKLFILIGVDTFLHFRALFKAYAMECAKPAQIILDEKFIKRVTGAVVKKRALQVSVPEIFDVSIDGLRGVYFSLESKNAIILLFFRHKIANCEKICVFKRNPRDHSCT